MVNFLFFSFQKDLVLQHLKISIKFDNGGSGKARISFKILIQKKDISEPIELFLYVQNTSREIKVDHIDKNYNIHLRKNEFQKAAGIKETKKFILEPFFMNKIDFKENPTIHNKKALFADKVLINEINSNSYLHQIPKMFFDEGVILKINPVLNEKIKNVKIQKQLKTNIIEFQYRIFCKNFLSKDTLHSWNSSSEPWSTTIGINSLKDFDGYDNLKEYIIFLEIIDLWVNIPHDHLFIASSPVYTNAIKLEKEDIEYKTYEGEKRDQRKYYEQFETQPGDYAVKINISREYFEIFKESSIICTSPFLAEETPSKLREDIEKFNEDIETFNNIKDRFVKWEDMISPLVLLLAVISILFSFPQYKGNISNEIVELIIMAVIFGLVVWAVNIVVEQVTKRIHKRWKIDSISLLLILILVSIILLLLVF